ncbi:MAG TPA: hypothetical protein PKD29_01710 [Rhodocyclaceae bacterium]|nr:hypothetical protein [Rhodocyclaceae bacterium]
MNGLMRFVVALTWVPCAALGGQREGGDEAWSFKLTPAWYRTTGEKGATDINLRANLGDHVLWIGRYDRGREFTQTRTGYEYAVAMPFGKLVPSLQIASRGFVGGSLNAEVGRAHFLLLGLGRTNTRDYYNLNFDPNDSALYGIGTRAFAGSVISLCTIRDNRLHTEQRVNHLVWRTSPDDSHRWTVDLFAKRGRPSAGEDTVAGTGGSVTYDFGAYFARLARDPKVNFTRGDMTRVALGVRF